MIGIRDTILERQIKTQHHGVDAVLAAVVIGTAADILGRSHPLVSQLEAGIQLVDFEKIAQPQPVGIPPSQRIGGVPRFIAGPGLNLPFGKVVSALKIGALALGGIDGMIGFAGAHGSGAAHHSGVHIRSFEGDTAGSGGIVDEQVELII
jgi:hypothetical protein